MFWLTCQSHKPAKARAQTANLDARIPLPAQITSNAANAVVRPACNLYLPPIQHRFPTTHPAFTPHAAGAEGVPPQVAAIWGEGGAM
jgi:hypothetical protein